MSETSCEFPSLQMSPSHALDFSGEHSLCTRYVNEFPSHCSAAAERNGLVWNRLKLFDPSYIHFVHIKLRISSVFGISYDNNIFVLYLFLFQMFLYFCCCQVFHSKTAWQSLSPPRKRLSARGCSSTVSRLEMVGVLPNGSQSFFGMWYGKNIPFENQSFYWSHPHPNKTFPIFQHSCAANTISLLYISFIFASLVFSSTGSYLWGQIWSAILVWFWFVTCWASTMGFNSKLI